MLSKDAIGRETKHKCTLPTQGNRPDAWVFLLVCCVARFWKSFGTWQCLAEQHQWGWSAAGTQESKLDICSPIWSREILEAEVHTSPTTSSSKINKWFWTVAAHAKLWEWGDLGQIHPHDAHVSSRFVRTYYTHFGVPLGSQPASGMIRKRLQDWDQPKAMTFGSLV